MSGGSLVPSPELSQPSNPPRWEETGEPFSSWVSQAAQHCLPSDTCTDEETEAQREEGLGSQHQAQNQICLAQSPAPHASVSPTSHEVMTTLQRPLPACIHVAEDLRSAKTLQIFEGVLQTHHVPFDRVLHNSSEGDAGMTSLQQGNWTQTVAHCPGSHSKRMVAQGSHTRPLSRAL